MTAVPGAEHQHPGSQASYPAGNCPTCKRVQQLTSKFRGWLTELGSEQLAALAENWDNIMDDAALTRINSWLIADKAIAELRAAQDRKERS